MSRKKLTMLGMEKKVKSLSLANENLIAEKDMIEDEIKNVMKKHRAKLRRLLRILIDKRAVLLQAIKDNPELFTDSKTFTVNGIKFGITKDQANFKYPKDDILVKLIEKNFPNDEILIKVTKKPIKNQIKQLEEKELKKIKVKKKEGKETPVIDIAVTDVEKIIKTILDDVEKEEKKEK